MDDSTQSISEPEQHEPQQHELGRHSDGCVKLQWLCCILDTNRNNGGHGEPAAQSVQERPFFFDGTWCNHFRHLQVLESQLLKIVTSHSPE